MRSALTVTIMAVLALSIGSTEIAIIGGGRAAAAHRARVPLYGVTLDDVSDPEAIGASLRALPRRPTVRLYFDAAQEPAAYAAAVRVLHRVSNIMGELLDSSDERRVSTAAYRRRVASYLAAFGKQVRLWEVGNEVNGNWTGSYKSVAAKLEIAYRLVAAAHKRSALTLFYDVGCGDGPAELDPLAFSRRYVPARVRKGLDVVLLSYYEQACGGARPSARVWRRYFSRLHLLYPHAELGFGEVGLQKPVDERTLSYARHMVRYYYGLHVALPYYIGGYFWWYYAEDCVPAASRPLWPALAAGFLSEARQLRPR